MNHLPKLLPILCGLFTTHAQLHGSETLIYKKVGNRELELLVDQPAGPKPAAGAPACVFFFGGGWVGGSPSQFARHSAYLASRGMVGIRVEYRTIPKGDDGPPLVCCEDAKSAVRYVRAHAGELGIDPNRIAASGGSAGGHLAAFTALLAGLDSPRDDQAVACKPNALVLFNPVFDNGPGEWGHQRVGKRYREFSPAHNVATGAPPTIVFLGDSDKLIPVDVVRRFEREMKKAGSRCDIHIYPGADHGFFNKPDYYNKTMVEADRFLASLGWLQGPPTLR
jgi:acetyl esterase/lipase